MHLFQIIPSLLAQAEKVAGPEATKAATDIVSDTAFKLENIVFVVWADHRIRSSFCDCLLGSPSASRA